MQIPAGSGLIFEGARGFDVCKLRTEVAYDVEFAQRSSASQKNRPESRRWACPKTNRESPADANMPTVGLAEAFEPAATVLNVRYRGSRLPRRSAGQRAKRGRGGSAHDKVDALRGDDREDFSAEFGSGARAVPPITGGRILF